MCTYNFKYMYTIIENLYFIHILKPNKKNVRHGISMTENWNVCKAHILSIARQCYPFLKYVPSRKLRLKRDDLIIEDI